MQAIPRPPARVLLCGRFLLPRVSLLALPDGPVDGIDLTRGVLVSIELHPAGARPELEARLREGDALHVHRARLVLAREHEHDLAPEVVRPAPVVAPQPVRRSLRGELGSRRARATLAIGVAVACAVVLPSLLGGSSPTSSRPARPVAAHVVAPLVVRPGARRPVRHPVAPTSRGGPARVLVVASARVARPVAVVHVSRAVAAPRRAPVARSPGWVDGLIAGS